MKITAVCAGLGVAVGAVLFVALRFVVGPSVLDGLGWGSDGTPRRYVDYLETRTAWSWSEALHDVGILLAAGLVAGALVGIGGWLIARVEPNGPLFVAALVPAGALIGVLLAVLVHVHGRSVNSVGTATFGWYSYSSVDTDGVFYGRGSTPSWWPLLLTGAVAGLIAGALAAGATLVRRRTTSRA